VIKLDEEQAAAYARYKRAADAVGIGKRVRGAWVPFSDVLGSLKPDGVATPLFIPNDAWLEYKLAAEAWLRVEPRFRHDERLRSTRGDYDHEDSWDEPEARVKDTFTLIKEGES